MVDREEKPGNVNAQHIQHGQSCSLFERCKGTCVILWVQNGFKA